jgi:hypothetical protein
MSVRSVRNVGVSTTANGLQAATASASTLQELISTMPRSYQALLGDHLTKKYRAMHKHANVQSTVTQYERHQTEDSLPPIIRNSLKEPKLQFAKEYLSSIEGKESPDRFRIAVKTARSTALDAALTEKQKELAYLSTLIQPEPSIWDAAVLNVARRIAADCGGRMVPHTQNPVLLNMDGVAESAVQDYQLMWGAAPVYTYRCMALARAAIDRNDLMKVAKLQIKSDTDTAMMDLDRDKPVKDIIKEELQAFRKELLAVQGKPDPAQKRKRPLLIDERQKICKKARLQNWQESESWQGQSEEKREEQRQEEWKLFGKEVSLKNFLQSCSKEFRPWRATEFPDVYCIMNEMSRMRVSFGFLPQWQADSIRTAQPGIFKFETLDFPKNLEYMLAVNHKFIFHSPMQSHDVTNAADRFARTVRIRWQFRNQRQKRDYHPKFHVPNPFWQPQKASPAIELGIEEAMKEIDSQVRQALSRVTSDSPFRGNMKWSEVQEFLVKNDLLVKLTDKNLGLAVFPKGWYIHQIMRMLGDVRTYRMASSLNVDKLYSEMIEQAKKWSLPPNMMKFLTEKTKREIPTFHAIPKVHKTPWTLRPIVPSHSWITSRLSEIIDHFCRPILLKLPWVVDSTKVCIQKLEEVKTNSEKCWIVTGDVVAFYTNINSSKCAEVVAGAWARYEPNSKVRPRFLQQMIQFIMNNNYFQFQGQVWKQQSGLAMGTSCAPVLANIYAGFYERQLRIPMQQGVRCYMRYIDDILLIFEGSEKELMAYLAKVKLGSLTINWSYSKTRKEFLDIEVMNIRTPMCQQLMTRLYKKPMNKHLYIPWSSAHPDHVKKAFVKAELIRFAIVSSEVEYFAEARNMFYGNLRRRGYPPQTLENWFQQVHYDQRSIFLAHQSKEEEETPIMLSGQYNPVWEYINVSEVMKKASIGWSLERKLPNSLQVPLIRSLSRSTNLGDLLSAWNKTILHSQVLATEKLET